MAPENLPNLPYQLPLISTSPGLVIFPNNTMEFNVSMSERLKQIIQTAGYVIIALPAEREKDEIGFPEYTYGAVAEIHSISEKKPGHNYRSVKFTGLFPVKIIRTENILTKSNELPYIMAEWEKIEVKPMENILWQDQTMQSKLSALKTLLKNHLQNLSDIAKTFSLHSEVLEKWHVGAEEALINVTKDTLSQSLDKTAMILSSDLRCRVKEVCAETRKQYRIFSGEKLEGFSLPSLSRPLLMMLGEPSLAMRVDMLLTLISADIGAMKQIKKKIQELGMTPGIGSKRADMNAENNGFQKIFEENKDKMPDDAKAIIERELARLERTPEHASEYHVMEKYVETLLNIPWGKFTADEINLVKIKTVLDEDHWGLDEAKERIVEFMAARAFNPKKKAPILHFDGPPGTGKTSLGRSIARALGRKFVRMSVGGIDDEAEIRGHRSTYVGAKPGRIIEALIRAETSNPVIMIDEVDKLGQSIHGDPASALLEALDPEQNFSFNDNYIATGVDLSQVLFITTSNDIERIPPPLLDRMETIEFSSYTEDEKVHIAEKFLIPKKLKEFALDAESEMLKQKELWPFAIKFTKEALSEIASERTNEAGVRELERKIDAIFRKIVKEAAETKQRLWEVNQDNLSLYLGNKRAKKHKLRQNLPIGVAPMLAVTPAGGLLLYVEAIHRKKDVDHRKIKITGVDPQNQDLGRMIEEQADAAWDFLFKEGKESGILADLGIPEKTYLHVRFANGGITKDGTSAGVAILWALYSLFTEQRIKDGLVATGEVTMAIGDTYPVGGIKEKIMAAERAGAKEVVFPKANEEDGDDIPDNIKEKIKIIPCESMLETLKIAFPNCEKIKKFINKNRKTEN